MAGSPRRSWSAPPATSPPACSAGGSPARTRPRAPRWPREPVAAPRPAPRGCRARAGAARDRDRDPAAIARPMMWLGELDLKSQLTLTLAIAVGSGGLALAARSRVMRPLQTLANLTASLRERDYAVRGRAARDDDSLGLA